MTPLTYDYLQQQGFRLLIPIVSQNQTPADLELIMWGREMNGRVIRLEYHKTTPGATDDDKEPFGQEGLRLFTGEKNDLELAYEATVFYEHELAHYIQEGK